MIASVEELKTEKEIVLRALYQDLPDLFLTVMNVIGTILYNSHAKKPIKKLFEMPERKSRKDKERNVIKVPKPDGTVEEIEIVNY